MDALERIFGTTKPVIAEGTRPGPKRAFDRY